MDYLRTLGSAAVSSLVQKSGLNLPFSLGAKVASLTVCNLFDGTKRDDGSPVSIFEYDFSDPSKRSDKQFAANALRKLRSTRHPDVLKFMDAVETDSVVYIMTERVRPLGNVLQSWSTRDAQAREDWLLWGLHRISTSGSKYPDSSSWAAPEVKKGGWSVLKEHDPAVADAYALGILLHTVFNPSQGLPATVHPPHPPPTASSRGSIPPTVFPSFKRLLNPNPKARESPKSFLEIGMADNGFFANNKLVKVCLGLDNFNLGSEVEKNALLRLSPSKQRALKESSASFPPEFTSNRVLPSLVNALEYGGASAPAILPLVLQFGSTMPPEDYPTLILTPLVKLYASPDRGTRMALLEYLPEYADKLDKKTVSDKIFPHLSTGFSDTVAVIREATTKSIILLTPKLNDRILNNDLLRFLAKMQTDPEASIRTNTCILIGRLGPTLRDHTRKKVLVPAFSRALKDTFVHARVAGLMAFMATIDCFEVDDIAHKVIPNIAFAMIDKEKLVRDQAFKAVQLFVARLEKYAATMPETSLSETADGSLPLASSEPATLVTTAAGAAGSLAGWAISSLGKKLMSSDLQTAIGASADVSSNERPISAPLPLSNNANPVASAFPSSGTMSASVTPIASPSTQVPRAKGMQLGGNRLPISATATILAEQWADEATESAAADNPWGNDDLIDINADEDDWSAFETAPTTVAPKPVPAVSGLGLTRNGIHSQPTPMAAQSPVTNKPAPNASSTHTTKTVPRARNGALDKSPSPTPAPTTPNLSEMSKEDKAAEMARRKEERKQEQKKTAART
ncbi:hypothetical protein H0H92_004511 [Tricholoma furcatifolium]|nr:hypothetical protein H0H92_004511 [Tricholoma furcatifolium]